MAHLPAMHPLASLRRALGVSQAGLAAQCGVSSGVVHSVENGRYDDRVASLVHKLCPAGYDARKLCSAVQLWEMTVDSDAQQFAEWLRLDQAAACEASDGK